MQIDNTRVRQMTEQNREYTTVLIRGGEIKQKRRVSL